MVWMGVVWERVLGEKRRTFVRIGDWGVGLHVFWAPKGASRSTQSAIPFPNFVLSFFLRFLSDSIAFVQQCSRVEATESSKRERVLSLGAGFTREESLHREVVESLPSEPANCYSPAKE